MDHPSAWRHRTAVAAETGFTLGETIFARVVMATGLLSLAGVFSYGVLALNPGGELLIAKEKATEGSLVDTVGSDQHEPTCGLREGPVQREQRWLWRPARTPRRPLPVTR